MRHGRRRAGAPVLLEEAFAFLFEMLYILNRNEEINAAFALCR